MGGRICLCPTPISIFATARSVHELFLTSMALDGMPIAEVSDRRDFPIAGAFNRQWAAIEKRAAGFGQFDYPVDTRFCLLGLHSFC